jgi:hypothetical protein
VQELLVQQHFIRYNIAYQYNEVCGGMAEVMARLRQASGSTEQRQLSTLSSSFAVCRTSSRHGRQGLPIMNETAPSVSVSGFFL